MRNATRRIAAALALMACATLAIRAQAPISSDEAEELLRVGTALFNNGRFAESLGAFDDVTRVDDTALAAQGRKGKVRSALRVGSFVLAQTEAERLRLDVPDDMEALALYGDTLWASGLFDEADVVFTEALDVDPDSSRALHGEARSLLSFRRLDAALATVRQALVMDPEDGELHATHAEILERMGRYDEAAQAYGAYTNLLPNSETSEKAAWARAQIEFLSSFSGMQPVEISEEDERTVHTVPFRLVNDKVVVRARVNGGFAQDFVLDTGSEETVISGETANNRNVRAITYTLSAGVGEVGLRGLELARLNSLQIGSLEVRNLPVIVKNPALQGLPRSEGESFSPLSLGMSMTIDYENQTLTIARQLPEGQPDIRLPMRVNRLALVRGVLNQSHPAYFVVDTGGEVISISSQTADSLGVEAPRHIPLQVWGSSGWDPDAYLLPGIDLDLGPVEYRNFAMVVLNLRAPSALLGFQLGGIVGHRFLSPYRVSFDLERAELRLEQY